MIKEIKRHVLKLFLIVIISLATLPIANAGTQNINQENVEMADAFREEGKIYVLTAIILIILFGFFGYAFMIDRKISRVEKILRIKSSTIGGGK